jgi:hypothetical protein
VDNKSCPAFWAGLGCVRGPAGAIWAGARDLGFAGFARPGMGWGRKGDGIWSAACWLEPGAMAARFGFAVVIGSLFEVLGKKDMGGRGLFLVPEAHAL